ncbi:MAG: hypothetical protein JSR82_20250 [Verrucomicrobia bacterium]|nr:hypothetical protein [Verrucomicrobiota bacterium]
MTQDWSIQSRGDRCARTQKPFAEGEVFYTLLHRDRGELRREDLCVEAFQAFAASAEAQPDLFSFWRSRYDPPAPAPVETVTKADAETSLRRVLAEGPPPERAPLAYLLAALLERKRLIKPVAVPPGGESGVRVLAYEHTKSGEIFLVPDAAPSFEEIGRLQDELAAMLGGGAAGT